MRALLTLWLSTVGLLAQAPLESLLLLKAPTAASSPTPELLWWKMNDGSGTTITGTVGGDGTTDADWAIGSGWTYLDFNGSTDDATKNSNLNPAVNVVSVSFWLNPDSIALNGLFDLGSEAAVNSFHILFNTSLGGSVYGDSGRRQEPFDPPSTATWTHVVMILDGSTANGDVRCFYDKVEQTPNGSPIDTKTGTSNFASASFQVADYAGLGFFYGGLMDDVRIYNRALSQGEIDQIYADRQ